jgi:hypothetical protein
MLIGYMKNKLILALMADNPDERDYLIDTIIQTAARRTIPIRPGRSFPRERKHRSRHSNNRKSAI